MCCVPGDLQSDPGVRWPVGGSDRWSCSGQPRHWFPCNHSDRHTGENNTGQLYEYEFLITMKNKTSNLLQSPFNPDVFDTKLD